MTDGLAALSDSMTSELSGGGALATHVLFVPLDYPAILQRFVQAHFLRKELLSGTGVKLDIAEDGAYLTNGDTITVKEKLLKLDKLIAGLEVLAYDVLLGQGKSRIKFGQGGKEQGCYIIPTGEGSLLLIGTPNQQNKAKKSLRKAFKETRLSNAIEALQSNNLDIVSRYIFANANYLDAVDDSENSLLMHAVFNENAHIAELILNQGASPDVGNMLTKKTPLMEAVCGRNSLDSVNERLDIIRLLISAKANIDAVDKKNGWNVGHYCIDCGPVQLLEFLVDNTDIDFGVRSSDGISPLSLAKKKRINDPTQKKKWAMMMKILEKVDVRRDKKYEFRFAYIDVMQSMLNSEKCMKHLTMKTKAHIGINFHGDAVIVVMDSRKALRKRLELLEKNMRRHAQRLRFENLPFTGGEFQHGLVIHECYVLFEGTPKELLVIGSSADILVAQLEIEKRLFQRVNAKPGRPEDANPLYCSLSLAKMEGEPKKMTEMCAKRKMMMLELLHSEESYIKALQDIFEFFVDPIQNQHLISSELTEHFKVLQKIKKNHEEFLKGLPLTDNIPSYVLDRIDFLKRYHTKWINSYAEITRQMSKLKDDSKAGPIMKKAPADFNHYFIQIIQRPPKYELLLRELYEKTQKNHWQYDDIYKALAHMESIVAHLNADKAESDRRAELIEWGDKLSNWDGNLIVEKRAFAFKYKCKIQIEDDVFAPGVLVVFSDLVFACSLTYEVKEFVENFDKVSSFSMENEELFGLRIEQKPAAGDTGSSLEVFSDDRNGVGKCQERMNEVLQLVLQSKSKSSTM